MSSSSSLSPIPSFLHGPQSAEPLPPLVVPLDDLTGTGYETRIARAVARRVRDRAPLLKVDMEPTSMSVSRNGAMALTSVDYSGVFVRATGALLPNPRGFVREDDPREVHEFVEKLNAGRKNVDALLSAIDGLRGVSEDWEADADELEAFLLGSKEGEGNEGGSSHPFPVLCGVYDPRRTALLKDLVDGNILYSLGDLEAGGTDFPARWPAQPDWSSLNPTSMSVSTASPNHVSESSVTYQSVAVVASGPSYSQTAFQGSSYLPGCYQGRIPSVDEGPSPTVFNVVDPSVVSRMSQELSALSTVVHSIHNGLTTVAGQAAFNSARFDSFLRMRGLTESGMRTAYSAVVQQKEAREREAMEAMVNSGVGFVLWIGTDVALVTDATRPVPGEETIGRERVEGLREWFPTAMNAPRGIGDDNHPGEPRVGAVSSGTVKALLSLALANWKAEVLAVAGTLPNNPNIPDRSFLESVAVAGATIASFSPKTPTQTTEEPLMDPSRLPSPPPAPKRIPDLPLPLGMSSTLFTSFESSVAELLADEANPSAERKAVPFSMKRVLRERLLVSPVLQSVLDHFRTVGSHVGTMEFSRSIEDQDGVLGNQVFTLPKEDAGSLLRGMFCPSRTRELQLRHRGVAQGDIYRLPGERIPSVPSGARLPTFFGALVADPLVVLERCPHLSGPSRKRLLRAYRRLRRVVENPPTPGTPVPDPEQELRDLSVPTPFSDRITQPRILQHTEGFLYRVLSEMKTRAANSTGKRVPVSSSSTTSATTVFVVEPLPDLRIPEFVLVPSSQK